MSRKAPKVTRLGGRVGSVQTRLHDKPGILVATGAAACVVGHATQPPVLAQKTVYPYSTKSVQEKTMRPADYRLIYRPQPDCLPSWVRRIWLWF